MCVIDTDPPRIKAPRTAGSPCGVGFPNLGIAP